MAIKGDAEHKLGEKYSIQIDLEKVRNLNSRDWEKMSEDRNR